MEAQLGADSGDHRAPRPAFGKALLAGVVALGATLFVGDAQASGADRTPGHSTAVIHPTGSSVATMCITIDLGPAESNQVCRDHGSGARRRLPVGEPAAVGSIQLQVMQAVRQAAITQCGTPAQSQAFGQCLDRIGTLPAGPDDVQAVRRTLTTAGYQDVVVRLARGDDPAPPRSLVYAVLVGDVCVIGYDRGGTGTGGTVGGALPDGSCLDP